MLDGWSIWAAIIVLMREIFVSGLREFLAELRVSVPVSRLAKWKTTMQLVAIAALLIAPAIVGGKQGVVINLGLTFFWATAIVTLYTGYDYFRAGLKHLVRNEMKVRYFAWVRERVGHAEEEIDVPADVASVADLIQWLALRDEGYAAAFAEPTVIRAALDQEHVEHDAALSGAREVAFFPPMTGG